MGSRIYLPEGEWMTTVNELVEASKLALARLRLDAADLTLMGKPEAAKGVREIADTLEFILLGICEHD